MEKRIVKIKKVPVELYKILKFENLASSGGEAKFMIVDGFVKVNGSIETRKRKKIYPGDTIETGGLVLEIQSYLTHNDLAT
ncbi:RNA-binding S4 domain-containing protein [Desulfobacula sp.]|uniref:RNA-binding S4 domain-containing protein n=1 Tax=Desulfobacula sp. TaxID=2593537 RepID=UPI0025C4C282|nr:RNA-binding S4 domain-containing protein [Desulfobacula sp.]MBC2705659.1 RNA-binding S4 domain-containing protein [Desulfobacula sp.]